MSLSGTLEIFPLEEVLRLVARSHQDGCLRVENGTEGRIYIENGSLTLATVDADESLRAQLVASGLSTEEALSRLDVSRGTLAEALAPSVAPAALTELIREHSIESLYRIRKPSAGNFRFQIDSRPRYATGQSFDIEMIISEAERRASEWADIETVVPDLGVPWRMVPTLEEESVNLSDSAWQFLAAMDGSCAVEDLAGRLGITTFQTARRMAELSRARLVEPVPASSPSYGRAPIVVTTPEREPEPEAESVPSEPEASPAQSWWEEGSGAGTQDVTGDVEEEEAESFEPASGERTESGDDSFLETVFGELEKTEDEDAADVDEDDKDDEDDDGGFGLLRRRGLGAAFRELADS